MKIKKLLKDKHDQIIEITKKYGATEVRLFGSIVKGSTTKTSDVDILVKMQSGATLLDLIAIKQDLEDLLGLKVDVVTEDSISPYIKKSILKEAVNF